MMLIRLQVPSKRRTSSPLFAYQLLSYYSLRDEIKRTKKDNYCRVYVFSIFVQIVASENVSTNRVNRWKIRESTALYSIICLESRKILASSYWTWTWEIKVKNYSASSHLAPGTSPTPLKNVNKPVWIKSYPDLFHDRVHSSITCEIPTANILIDTCMF